LNHENGNLEEEIVSLNQIPSSQHSHHHNRNISNSESHSSRSHRSTSSIPTEDKINFLMNMGFTRQQATAALTQAHNDLQVAISLLVDGT
jgi:Holliday junction resolvasome RuvABC DNA-binding subunit